MRYFSELTPNIFVIFVISFIFFSIFLFFKRCVAGFWSSKKKMSHDYRTFPKRARTTYSIVSGLTLHEELSVFSLFFPHLSIDGNFREESNFKKRSKRSYYATFIPLHFPPLEVPIISSDIISSYEKNGLRGATLGEFLIFCKNFITENRKDKEYYAFMTFGECIYRNIEGNIIPLFPAMDTVRGLFFVRVDGVSRWNTKNGQTVIPREFICVEEK